MKIDLTDSDDVTRKVNTLADDRAMRGRLVKHLAREWGIAAQAVVGSAVRHRFTGKGPFPVAEHRLGVRSGRLRRSVRATAPQASAATGEVSVYAGSNVSYFAPHEFGFRGRVQVRGHTRRLTGEQKISRGRLTKRTQSQAAARRRAGYKTTAQVRPHHREMNVPERAPLGTEIRSERGRSEFRKAQQRAVNRTYQEVMS